MYNDEFDPGYHEECRLRELEHEFEKYLQDREDERTKMISNALLAIANSINNLSSKLK